MKKIIDGKVYNTETAALLGEWSNGYSNGDFNYVEENLYQTKKGQYFLQYGGGALTDYGVQVGNSRGYGEGIQLLDKEEAKDWAESRLTADEFITLFGEVEEG